MAYSADLAKIPTDRITNFAALICHQRFGHLANLDFRTA